MKTIATIISLCAAALCLGCHKSYSPANPDVIVAEGNLERLGMTTYQYGTHVLSNANGYVLGSKSINLNLFVGKKVEITAYDVHYQVEQGPTLYEVTSVREK
jgi:hypothetical protein